MALKIRLARGGAKKRPFYQIVIADARSPRDGRFVEKVGSYNPMLPREDQARIKLNEERIKYWLSKGAQPTDRVALFLGNAKIIQMPEIRETPKKSAPKAKAQERLREAQAAEAEKAAALAEAEAAPAPEPEAAPEAAAEAAPEVPAAEPEAPAAEEEKAPEAEQPAEEEKPAEA